MTSFWLFIILTVLATFAPSILTTDYVVDDDKGWTINFNYQAWAWGKMFFVDDNLGVHNVYKVNGTGFQECSAPLDYVPLTSGKDAISLATSGRKWYICGVSRHCLDASQKLAIIVFPSSFAPSPSPTLEKSGWKFSAPIPIPTWGYSN